MLDDDVNDDDDPSEASSRDDDEPLFKLLILTIVMLFAIMSVRFRALIMATNSSKEISPSPFSSTYLII